METLCPDNPSINWQKYYNGNNSYHSFDFKIYGGVKDI